MLRNNKTILSLIAGLLLSGVALYLTFRNIPLHELASYLKAVNYWWVIPAVAVVLMSFLIRVVRWQLLLHPIKKTGFWSAFHPLMIGFMLNCLLPARVGELARPAIFYKKERVSFSKVLATVGAERVFDIVMLLKASASSLSPDRAIRRSRQSHTFHKRPVRCLLLGRNSRTTPLRLAGP